MCSAGKRLPLLSLLVSSPFFFHRIDLLGQRRRRRDGFINRSNPRFPHGVADEILHLGREGGIELRYLATLGLDGLTLRLYLNARSGWLPARDYGRRYLLLTLRGSSAQRQERLQNGRQGTLFTVTTLLRR